MGDGRGPQKGERGVAVGQGTWKGRLVRYRKSRLVLRLVPGSDPDACLREILETTAGASCVRGPSRGGRVLIALPADADVLAHARRLEARDDVLWAEPDLIDTAMEGSDSS